MFWQCLDGIGGNGSCVCYSNFRGSRCQYCSSSNKHGPNCDTSKSDVPSYWLLWYNHAKSSPACPQPVPVSTDSVITAQAQTVAVNQNPVRWVSPVHSVIARQRPVAFRPSSATRTQTVTSAKEPSGGFPSEYHLNLNNSTIPFLEKWKKNMFYFYCSYFTVFGRLLPEQLQNQLDHLGAVRSLLIMNSWQYGVCF